MHVSRGVFLKTCGLAFIASSVDTPVVRAIAGAPDEMPLANDDVFVGQILTVPYNFAPTGFAFCHGQLLSISQNTALFSLLGTTYGGNGTTNFALPNLQGSVPMHFGQGQGLTDRNLGEIGGSETTTLVASEMPAHTHTISTALLAATARCKNGAGTLSTPVGNVPAVEGSSIPPTYGDGAADASTQTGNFVVGGSATAAAAGGGSAHNTLAPSLVFNYVIAVQGIFPPRD